MTNQALEIDDTNIDTVNFLFRSLFNIDDSNIFSQHKTNLFMTIYHIYNAFKQNPDKWQINNNIMKYKHQNYSLIIKMIKLNIHKYLNDQQMSWLSRYLYDKELITSKQIRILLYKLKNINTKIDH